MSERVATNDPLHVARSSRRINVVIKRPETAPPLSVDGPDKRPQGVKTLAEQSQFSEIVRELDRMIGLDNVKQLIYEIYALLLIGKYRAEAGLASPPQVYHMIFKGNPGTGKTTVARIVARLFQSMGMLSKGHMIEVERADLVGEYIGHTALKTRELIKKAMGGVLFIDEAYSLARGGEKDFGKEAIDTMVKAMEDHKTQFILILAGYTEEMEQFVQTNPGLESRFPIQLEFSDYTVEQLLEIADLMAAEREYSFTAAATSKLKQHLLEEKHRVHSFSNARYVRNVLEKSIRHHAVRLLKHYTAAPGKHDLMTIRPEDIKTGSAPGD